MSSLQEHAQNLLAPNQPPPAIAASPPDPNAALNTSLAPAPDLNPPASFASEPTPLVPGTGPVDPAASALGAEEFEPRPINMFGAHNVLRAAQTQQRDADKLADQSMIDAKKASQDRAEITGQQTTAQQPLLDQQVKDQQAQLTANQDSFNRVHAAGQKYAADYGVTMQAMQDKYDTQPQDVFGRAGVNKIAGTIGLILGGLAASATGGKNTAIERLNQLTQQKLAQDKYEYEMLGKKANMQTNLYAQLRSQGMDDIAATNGAAAIKSGVILSQLKATENKFAPSKAKADAQSAIAELEARTNVYKNQGAQHVQAQAMQVAQMDQHAQEFNDNLAYKRALAQSKLKADANAIQNDAIAPSNTFWKDNRVLAPRLFTTNSQLKLLDSKFQEALRTSDPTTAGVLRDEMASIAAQIETGIPNPADPQVEAAKARFGANSTFGIQGGRLRPGSKEATLSGNYIQSAFENHIRALQAAGFKIVDNGDLNQTYLALKKRGYGTPAGVQGTLDSILDEHKELAKSVLSGSARVNDYLKDGTLH